MLCLVPQYFSKTLLVVGASIILADVVYLISSPRNFNIRFPDAEGEMAVLSFAYGWCLWATIAAGISLPILYFLVYNYHHQLSYHQLINVGAE